MGRYYSGDIQGKFWFAVQPSDAADRFGVVGEQSHINYYFDESDLDSVRSELERIKTGLGNKMEKLDKFFSKNIGYNEEMIAKCLRCKIEKVKDILRDYADYQLGKQIEDCLVKNGYCSFEAEL